MVCIRCAPAKGGLHGFDLNNGEKYPMAIRVLVAYATKYGATAGIAEKLGEGLRHAGLPADVTPVERVGDLTPYGAVVLGSAVYIGQWRKEAAAFLTANEQALSQRAVWLFSSGPTGTGDPVQRMNGFRFPADLQPIADRIHPRDTAFFHGVIDMKKVSLPEKLIIKGIKAPLGDFRDWGAISSWAEGIAGELKK
jgi:menaquinone-dependent protoporphyrinogen oxidase